MSVMQVGKWARGEALPPDWWVPKADGRTLDINLLLGQIWDNGNGARPMAALSVSRLSERRRVGPTGLIETVGSGRIARDFTVAGAARGLRIEPETTNLSQRSGDLAHAAWSKGGATVATGALAPDGVQTFGRVTENSAAGQHFISQDIGALVIGDVLTITALVRATGIGSARHVFLTAYGESYAVFNPSTGAIVSAPGVTASVEIWSPGIYIIRCTVTKTNTNGTIFLGLWNPAGNNSYTGDGVSCVDAWGLQPEKRGTPTSYMPTVASTAVRNADGVSMALGSWFNPLAGTLLAEVVIPYALGTATYAGLASISDGTLANRVTLAHYHGTGLAANGVIAGNVGQAVFATGPTLVAGAVRRHALAWAANDVQNAVNGVLSATDTSATIPSGLTRLDIGALTASASNPLNGWILRLTYWPYRMAGAEMQARTAA